MMKKLMVVGMLASFFTACSTEGDVEVMEKSAGTISEAFLMTTSDIAAADLLGRWNIVEMEADQAADLNFDGQKNVNLLDETDCFNTMFFEFDAAGNVSTQQARLFFGADKSKFYCMGTGVYSADFEINGDQLKVFFSLNGTERAEVKTVTLSTDGTDEFLTLKLTAAEAQVYVDNTSGTVASGIGALDLHFKKE